MIKIYTNSKEEKDQVQVALNLLSSVFEDFLQKDANELASDEEVEATKQFLKDCQLTQCMAQLDTALLSEIGKAYKEQFEAAKSVGNQDVMNKMLGAMFAIKKVMDMATEPQY